MKSMKKTGGLRKRWLLNTVGVVFALGLVCVMAVTASYATYYYSNMQSDMENRAKTTTDFFADYINQDYGDYYQSCITYAKTFEDKGKIELQFINNQGSLVASSYGPWAGPSPSTSDIWDAISIRDKSSYIGRDPDTGERIMAVSCPMIYSNGEVIGVLRYVTSTRLVNRQIVLVCLVCCFVLTVVLAVVLLSSGYCIRSILNPVAEITEKAQRIASGSYGVQIQRQFDDEIGELADTINDMSNKISQSEKMQSEFMSSVSHELRTPLTAISGWSETLLEAGGSVDSTDARRGLGIILRESKRLTGMVEELLEFTRMQDGRFTLNVAQGDIRAEFEDTVFMYGSRLAQENIELQYLENEDDIPEIPCDTARMRQVFLNILDNAAKHGGEGGKITAEICREGDFVVVRIRDFGPGIPEEELPLVKKKFYKGTSKARGSGIGLAVCEEIVTMHNGTLELANAEGGGTVVTIRLPIAES